MSMENFDIGLEEETKEEKVVSFEEVKENKSPWSEWTVKGVTYKLKLTSAAQLRLEKKYKCNVLDLFTSDIPALSIMLTIVQAAMEKYQHGIDAEKVLKIYDDWVEHEDGSQIDFLQKVVMPTLAVSGFFTRKQAQEMLDDLKTSL